MSVLLYPITSINEFFDKHGDPRTANLPLMSSPIPNWLILAFYIYFVKILGPRLMEKRQPFQLKNVLIGYNFFQVILSAYLAYEFGISGWLTGDYNYFCQPMDYSNNAKAIRMMNVCWAYYVAKLTELADTIFFVLRKKFKQVSTLHLIHHTVMPWMCWFGVKISPGGHGTFFALLNSIVHVIMYGYYFLSAQGPGIQKYLWWKKYITTLQLIQFGVVLIHNTPIIFTACPYPRYFVWGIGFNAIMFGLLFSNFYNQTYKKNKSCE